MENESISKGLAEALKSFDSKTKQVPAGYFDQFEMNLMQQIKVEEQAPQKARIVNLFLNQKKYLVAASLLFAIATGYLFFNKAENTTTQIAKLTEGDTMRVFTVPPPLIDGKYFRANVCVGPQAAVSFRKKYRERMYKVLFCGSPRNLIYMLLYLSPSNESCGYICPLVNGDAKSADSLTSYCRFVAEKPYINSGITALKSMWAEAFC